MRFVTRSAPAVWARCTALSHANIGAIYGLEESGGVRFLVLELIEGETLEQRSPRRALPVPEALDIARQIAEKTYDDILDAIRSGRIFVTTGDLISELDVTASVAGVDASIGGELSVPAGADVTVTVRVRDPRDPNSNGDTPTVARVDVITGDVGGRLEDPTQDTNATTRVARRFTESDWGRDGEYLVMTYVLEKVERDGYVRVRGTNTGELEPEMDPRGEDPWSDLWFYSNPIFLHIR